MCTLCWKILEKKCEKKILWYHLKSIMSISKNTQKKIFSKENIITSIILVVIIFILDRVSKTTIINHSRKFQSEHIY